MATVTMINNANTDGWINLTTFSNNSNFKEGVAHSLRLKTIEGEITVDWGDGFVGTYASSDNLITHTMLQESELIRFKSSHGLPDFTHVEIRYFAFSYEVLPCTTFSPLVNLEVLIINSFKLEGDANDLPSTLKDLYGSVALKGDLFNDLPNLERVGLRGYDTGLTVDLNNCPNNLIELFVNDNCFITGQLINLPTTVIGLQLSTTDVSSDVIGSLSTLHEGLLLALFLDNVGISGDINDIPDSLVLIASGISTIYGDVGTITSTELKSIQTSDSGSFLEGDLNTLPVNVNIIFLNASSSDITGNVTTMLNRIVPSEINLSEIKSSYTVTPPIVQLYVKGDAIMSISSGLSINQPTAKYNVHLEGGNSTITAGQLDQFLIDLDNSNFIKQGSVFTLKGNIPPRTATSDAAYASLIADGVLIYLNT